MTPSPSTSVEEDGRPPWRLPSVQVVLGLLAALLAAMVLATVQTGSPAPVLLVPLAAVLGPIVGLTSDAPYFTATFKLELGAALLVAFGLMVGGWRLRERVLARIAVVLGAILWVIAGLVGFGPQ